MTLTRKQRIVLGSVGAAFAVAAIVGIVVGVTVGRRKATSDTVQVRVNNLLAENPLIDG
jgi:ABC-type nitrate/sulfonate/bicarbonate transport system permease component